MIVIFCSSSTCWLKIHNYYPRSLFSWFSNLVNFFSEDKDSSLNLEWNFPNHSANCSFVSPIELFRFSKNFEKFLGSYGHFYLFFSEHFLSVWIFWSHRISLRQFSFPVSKFFVFSAISALIWSNNFSS